MKKCVFCRFPARIAKFNNVWWFFSYWYNMRLKSPCEIASDMTLWFSAFPNFRKNGRICGFHWTFKSKKCLSFRGASPPDLPTKGSAPGPRWSSTPRPSLWARALRARHRPPLCQILNTPLNRCDIFNVFLWYMSTWWKTAVSLEHKLLKLLTKTFAVFYLEMLWLHVCACV